MALPQKWCIERTAANGAEINGYFNRLHGNPSGYEKRSGWMTNDTKKDEKGPFKEKPKGYTEITFFTFKEEILDKENINGAPAPRAVQAANGLPEAWCVRGDGSQLMVEFAGLINARFNIRWTGTSNGYYGFSNGEFRSRYDKEAFGPNVVEYTPTEIIALVKNLPAAGVDRIDLPQPARRGVPAAPPVFHEQVIVDYTIAKRWPGGGAVGSSVQANGVVALSLDIYGDAEFFTPVMRNLPALGDIVVVTRAHNNVAVGTYSVVQVNFNNRQSQYYLRLRDRNGTLSNEIPLVFIRPADAAEVQGFRGIQINGLNVLKNVQNGTVTIGNVNLPIATVRNLRSAKENDAAGLLTINLRNIGALSTNNLVDLVAFYDA